MIFVTMPAMSPPQVCLRTGSMRPKGDRGFSTKSAETDFAGRYSIAGVTPALSRANPTARVFRTRSDIPRTEHIMPQQCTHLDTIRDVSPNTQGCEECLKMGDTWVHLRMCLHCGHVGCCNSSKNKHAPSISTRQSIPSCDRSNLARVGPGVMWMNSR